MTQQQYDSLVAQRNALAQELSALTAAIDTPIRGGGPTVDSMRQTAEFDRQTAIAPQEPQGYKAVQNITGGYEAKDVPAGQKYPGARGEIMAAVNLLRGVLPPEPFDPNDVGKDQEAPSMLGSKTLAGIAHMGPAIVQSVSDIFAASSPMNPGYAEATTRLKGKPILQTASELAMAIGAARGVVGGIGKFTRPKPVMTPTTPRPLAEPPVQPVSRATPRNGMEVEAQLGEAIRIADDVTQRIGEMEKPITPAVKAGGGVEIIPIETAKLPSKIRREAEKTIPDEWGYNEGEGTIGWVKRRVSVKELVSELQDDLAYDEFYQSRAESLAKSIKKSGVVDPIVIGPGGIEGYHRIRAAELLGIKELDVYEYVPDIEATATTVSRTGRVPSLEEIGDRPGTTPSSPVSPVAVKGEATTKVKEPWEMTRQAYVDQNWKRLRDDLNKEQHRAGILSENSGLAERRLNIDHMFSVRDALKSGHPVPASVLADYPDLAAKYGKKPVPGQTALADARGAKAVGPRSEAQGAAIEARIDLSAKNLIGNKGSQRVGAFDWTVDGNEVVVGHSVTGREYGRIDLATGEMTPHKPSDISALRVVYSSIKKIAEQDATASELARLKDYPFKNKKRIGELEKPQPPAVAAKEVGATADLPEGQTAEWSRENPWHGNREEVFKVMREADKTVWPEYEKATKLGPRNGAVSIGGADFDHLLKAEVGRTFLSSLNNGKHPDVALKDALSAGKATVDNWNNKTSKGRASYGGAYQNQRWEGAGDQYAYSMYYRFRDIPTPDVTATPSATPISTPKRTPPPAVAAKEVVAEGRGAKATPAKAVEDIVEGKAESSLGTKEFKKQMVARLDEAIAKAQKSTPELDDARGKRRYLSSRAEIEREIAQYKKEIADDPVKGWDQRAGRVSVLERELENYHKSEKYVSENRAAYDKAREPFGTVTIEIPGDGTFTIENTVESLAKVKKSVQGLRDATGEVKPFASGVREGTPHELKYKFETAGSTNIPIPKSPRPSGKMDIAKITGSSKYVANGVMVVEKSLIPETSIGRIGVDATGAERVVKAAQVADVAKKIVKPDVMLEEVGRLPKEYGADVAVFYDGKQSIEFDAKYIDWLHRNVKDFRLGTVKGAKPTEPAVVLSGNKPVGIVMPMHGPDVPSYKIKPLSKGAPPSELSLGVTPEQAGRALGPLTPDFLKQARNRMGKSSYAKQLSDLIEKKADPVSNRRAGQEIEAMRQANLKGIDGEKLAADMEAGKAPAFKRIMDRMYYKAKAVGVDVVGYRDNYFPRMLKEDIRQILYDDLRTAPEKVTDIENFVKAGEVSPVTAQVIKHLVDTGQAASAVKAWTALRSYVSNDLFRPFANLEKARTLDFPLNLYERDAKVVLPRYVRDWSKRLAEVETFGPNGETAQNLVEHISRLNPREGRYAKQVVDSWTGQIDADRPLHPTMRKASDAYTNIQMGTKIALGYSTLKNAFQTFISTVPRAGFYRVSKAAVKLFDPAFRSKFVRGSGATIQTAHDALSGRQSSGPMSKFANFMSKYSGFEGINKVNQYISAAAGHLWVKDLHKIANGQPHPLGRLAPERSPARAQNILRDEFGIDYRKPLTENQILEATYRFATDTQLQKNILSDPLSANDPRFRPFWLFKRFGYRQAVLIKDKIVKQELIANDNPLPMLRLVAGGIGSGLLVKEVQKVVDKIVSGKERTEADKDIIERATDAFANAGAMGVMSDLVAADDKLRQLQFSATPIQVSDLTKIWDVAMQVQEDMDKYAPLDVARRAVKPTTKLLGSFPARLGQRFQTEGQAKGEQAYWKGQRRSELFDAILAKESEKAKGIADKWNKQHPEDPIIGYDEDIFDLVAQRAANKAKRKANP